MPEEQLCSNQIWDEAAAFVDQLVLGDHTDLSALEASQRWRAQSDEHEKAFTSLMNLARDNALVESLAAHDMSRPALNFTWTPPKLSFSLAPRQALVALFCAIGAVYFLRAPIADLLVPGQPYTTAFGETRTLKLEDGSELTLNGGTELDVRLTPFRRNVKLHYGEAFFSVAKDPGRPFRVSIDGGEVRVVGTRFNLSYMPDGVELNVYQGQVRLWSDHWQSALIARGQSTQLTPSGIANTRPLDLEGADWRGGWIEVEDWTLERAAQELTRRSGAAIHFADDQIRAKKVTARLKLSDPEGQLMLLSRIHGFQVTRESDAQRPSYTLH